MFKIGDFSRLSNVSVRMLRHYEKLGLLLPEKVDAFSGYRYYSAAQLEKIGKIEKLKSLGFSLAVVGKMLEEADLEMFFEMRKQELQEELARISAQANMLDSIKQILSEDATMMNYHVNVKEIPARYVMSARKVIPSYQEEGMLWNILYGEYQKQGVSFDESGPGMAIFHDKEYKEQNVDVEVQSAIKGASGDYADTQAVKFYLAPAVQVASVTFRGSYDQMPSVSEALAKWIEDNGYAINGLMMNIYHVSPGQDPNPENWVTEACIAVEKK
ncbi:MAG: MerR family transcriptional regulator [Christensenellaceae bacterium]|jgi:DNA-binding transcriptional MerR regulator